MDQAPFFDQFIDEYYQECDEHLAAIRRVLLAFEELPLSAAAEAGWSHELQRGLHTLKGLSGMVGLASAERVAHALEDALRAAGPTPARLDPQLIETLFEGARLFDACIAAHRDGTEPPSLEALLRDVASIAGRAGAPDGRGGHPVGGGGLTHVATSATQVAAQADEREVYRFEFAPSAEIAARGVTVDVVRQRLQALGELLGAQPRVTAGSGIVFEFRVAVPRGVVPDDAWRGDRLSWMREERRDGELLGVGDAATAGAPDVPDTGGRGRAASIVRVDLSRLEELMRAVGDLVVSRSRLAESLRGRPGDRGIDDAVWEELNDTNTAMERQLRVLRDNVMRIRLVRVGEVFERLRYAVRDVARESGKEVAIVLEGQDTEIDKAVVDRVLEPLMHLVRNAVSHGIEPADVRRARGKSGRGALALRATAAGDRIVIQVEDDGGGIDRAAVAGRLRALELPVVDLDDDAALLEAICAPGFSTRSDADLSSGRGVGMDVVRSAVRELGGELALATGPTGTRFTLQLPLTLTIADALLVDIAGQQMAVPQQALREIIQVDAHGITTLEHNEIVSYRGRVLPLVSLRRLFGLAETGGASRYVLVVGADPQLAGLVVDRILGLREIVVHPVTDPLVAVPGVGGATELGDGRVSLILDASALVRLATARPAHWTGRAPAALVAGA